mgnify:FL=1
MPKMKSRASVKKRYDLTANDHVKRKQAYHSHILSPKSTKRRRNLRKNVLVDKTQENKIKRMLST